MNISQPISERAENIDALLDFFPGDVEGDIFSGFLLEDMEAWKEGSDDDSEETINLCAIQSNEDNVLDSILQSLNDPDFLSSPLACVERIPDGARPPEREIKRTFIRQKQGGDLDVVTESDLYSMSEPADELDALATVASNRRKRSVGRPRKRRITLAPGPRPQKRTVHHKKAQIDALRAAHGWTRSVGCCPDTVAHATVEIRGEYKPHHKSWYRRINDRLRAHLLDYHELDLRVEEVPFVVQDNETGAFTTDKRLVCMQKHGCGKEFENTPEGTYQCIQHLRGEHGITQIIHKSDL
jgi:hypothetical protein